MRSGRFLSWMTMKPLPTCTEIYLLLYRAEAEGIRLEDGQQMAWFHNHFRLPAPLVPNNKTALSCPAFFGSSRARVLLAPQSQLERQAAQHTRE